MAADKLYLDDLHVGYRHTSGTHTIDEAEIKAFARQFDPQPFHLDDSGRQGHVVRQPGGQRLAYRGDHHAPAD